MLHGGGCIEAKEKLRMGFSGEEDVNFDLLDSSSVFPKNKEDGGPGS